MVRPENLHLTEGSERFAVRIVNRLFEGDRIDYQVEIPGSGAEKPLSMSVPFLPGTELLEVGSDMSACFTPQAGVVIRR